MIRNLVLKLPGLRCASDYVFTSSARNRDFRSLSPVQRVRSPVNADRSLSCSRVESGHIVDLTRIPRARTHCLTKKRFAQKHDDSKEAHWRDSPKENKEEDTEREREKSERLRFENLEQYELEAAKPRPAKSRDVIEAFTASKSKDHLMHLQPNQIQPYGSQNSMYAPFLIRPTNLLKYPRKSRKKGDTQEPEKTGSTDLDSSTHRNYSTSSDLRRLSTSKSYVGKEVGSPKNIILCNSISNKFQKSIDNVKGLTVPRTDEETNLRPLRQVCTPGYKEAWAEPTKKLDFTPPVFQSRRSNFEGETDFKFSTAEMRKKRRERENQNSDRYYKSCYSDVVKIKLRDLEKEKLDLLDAAPLAVETTPSKVCSGGFGKDVSKSGQILQTTRAATDRRSLTTRSKSNLLSKKTSSKYLDLSSNRALLTRKTVDDFQEHKNYSKSKSKNHKTSKKKQEDIDYEAGCDVCTPMRTIENKLGKGRPMEPQNCGQKMTKKVFLPSRVKLSAIAACTPPPDYRECVKVDPCPPRADECLVVTPKKLPKLNTGECQCINPHMPTKAPKLEKLNFKFEDPPRVVCHPPPCQTPRADDSNPHKFKPLKPYTPGDCECIQPPELKDVKLKRLPRCEPEEVCRPIRVCPVIEKCPPRADECLRIVPKRLPIIEPSLCPCIDPPMPKTAPPIKRLDLSVPEPERPCPRPLSCKDRKRADDDLRLKKKRLPKFVPGDCPCEDRPMVDWSPKRLVCEEEVPDCVVPNPCKAFPRADWGCWEYPDEICEIVEPRCIETKVKCPPPAPPKRHPCDKDSICDKGGFRDIRHTPKRRYSKSSASLKLYQQVKSQNIGDNEGYIKTSANAYRAPEIKKSRTKIPKSAKVSRNSKKVTSTKHWKCKSTISLLKMLNDLDLSKKDEEEPYLFKPIQDNRVNYDKILKKIASSTVLAPPRREEKSRSFVNTLKKSKTLPLKVTSRAISTTKSLRIEDQKIPNDTVSPKDEKYIRHQKDCQGKKKCQNIISKMCSKRCASFNVCAEKPKEIRSCRTPYREPECERQKPPYTAYTDNMGQTIKPFTTKTPQWNCNKISYGFYPNYRKEFEPLDDSRKKNKKEFSTCPIGPELFAPSSNTIDLSPTSALHNRYISNTTSTSIPIESTKALLKMSSSNSIVITQSRTLTSRIFQIAKPVPGKPKTNKNCKVVGKDKRKMACTPPQDVGEPRYDCKRVYINPHCKRKSPPFPAFSDCLDEEMEDILTECPLDKEKYLRMQPRFMRYKKPFTLKPPPPIQGRLDLLKEAHCIRDKLCIENEGLTQHCRDFGKPVPLMKSKQYFQENDIDYKKTEHSKKTTSRPTRRIKQNRRFCTSSLVTAAETSRSLSTIGLNCISDISKRVERLYVRNYHALVKSTEKAVLVDNEAKLKEFTKNMFPDMDESTKILKLRKNQWKLHNVKSFELLNHQGSMAKSARRSYTTYKTKRRNFLRMHNKGCTLKTYFARRKVSYNSKLLKYRTTSLRGNRSLKSNRATTNARRERCQAETNKKSHSKFTLNSAPTKHSRKTGVRKISGKFSDKSISPFPAFSESKKFSRSESKNNQQSVYNIYTGNRNNIQQYPDQEKINRNLSFEYYKCKHGLKSDGCTVDCESLGFCTKCKTPEDDCKCENKCGRKKSIVELFVQEHKKQKLKAIEACRKCKQQPCCCCQSKPKCEEDVCEPDRKKLEEICMEHCLKCIPCHLPEEEKYCVCKEECRKIFQKSQECPALEVECEEEKVCPKPCCEVKCKEIPKCPKPEYRCGKCKSDSKVKTCTVKTVICPPKRSRSIAQLENLWQRIVCYFKARPNCPEPGEWKKKALREKAEKAAKAAGLVALNPKCLPPEILRTAKVPQHECKICPNKDPCEKRDCDCECNKSASPRLPRRNFSTVVQPSRSYSRSTSSQNLKEINNLLDESETQQKLQRYDSTNPKFKKEYAIFSERKDSNTSRELKMSLDKELHESVDLGELCCKDGSFSRTYFGYSDIIPSRENILERAWRVSIESYNKYNYPKSYTFFNEFLNKIEKSIHSVEDLEKLKTENVLRELDEFLKNQDADKNKK